MPPTTSRISVAHELPGVAWPGVPASEASMRRALATRASLTGNIDAGQTIHAVAPSDDEPGLLVEEI